MFLGLCRLVSTPKKVKYLDKWNLICVGVGFRGDLGEVWSEWRGEEMRRYLGSYPRFLLHPHAKQRFGFYRRGSRVWMCGLTHDPFQI